MKLSWSLLMISHADVWHGEEDIAKFEVTNGCVKELCQNCMLSNLFDDSIYSFFFSEYDPVCYNNPNKHLMATFKVFFKIYHQLISSLQYDFSKFQDPINFQAITLHKRITASGDAPPTGTIIKPQQHCCSAGITTFNNVCLVLDGDVDNELCTDAAWGWSRDDWQT